MKRYNHHLGYNNLYKCYFILFLMDLLKFLQTNENTRKIFGKRELKIIEKQILGINLSQSEKNRLSRDIRKKLKFIKEIEKFKQDFELKKAQEIKHLINDAIEVILDDELRNKIKEIWLFGSVVENKLTFRSDIDIAVHFNMNIIKEQAFKFRARISGRVNKKIDIQVFEFLPKKIQKDILKKYKILWKKE